MLLHNIKIILLVVFPVNVGGGKFLLIRYVGNSPFSQNTQHTGTERPHMGMGQSVPKASMPCKPQRNMYSPCPICEEAGKRAEARANDV